MTAPDASENPGRRAECLPKRNPEHLTVQGLIRLLSEQPPDLRVVVDGYECGYDDLSAWQIQRVRTTLNTGRAEYAGAHDDVVHFPRAAGRGRGRRGGGAAPEVRMTRGFPRRPSESPGFRDHGVFRRHAGQ